MPRRVGPVASRQYRSGSGPVRKALIPSTVVALLKVSGPLVCVTLGFKILPSAERTTIGVRTTVVVVLLPAYIVANCTIAGKIMIKTIFRVRRTDKSRGVEEVSDLELVTYVKMMIHKRRYTTHF